jgi:hypothetical protein
MAIVVTLPTPPLLLSPKRCHEHETQSLLSIVMYSSCNVLLHYLSCNSLLASIVIWLPTPPPLLPPKGKPSIHHCAYINDNPTFKLLATKIKKGLKSIQCSQKHKLKLDLIALKYYFKWFASASVSTMIIWNLELWIKRILQESATRLRINSCPYFCVNTFFDKYQLFWSGAT